MHKMLLVCLMTTALTSTWSHAETKTGTSSLDVLTGGKGADKLYGLGGNDVLFGDPFASLFDGSQWVGHYTPDARNAEDNLPIYNPSYSDLHLAPAGPFAVQSASNVFLPNGVNSNGIMQIYVDFGNLSSFPILITGDHNGMPGDCDSKEPAISPNGRCCILHLCRKSFRFVSTCNSSVGNRNT
jgi:Ca2+-binding RTX toxin-like protein